MAKTRRRAGTSVAQRSAIARERDRAEAAAAPGPSEKVAWYSVLTAVVLVPLVFWRGLDDNFDLAKLTVLWICVVVGLAGWVVWSVGRRRWLPPMQIAPFVVEFVAIVALSTILSVSPAVSVLGRVYRYGGFVPLVTLIALAMLVVALCWEHTERLRTIAVAATVAGATCSLYMIVARLGLDWDWYNPSSSGYKAPLGTLGNPILAGGFLAVVIPLAIYLVSTSSGWHRLGAAAALAVEAIALTISLSRGPWLAAVGGVAIAGLVAPRLLPRLVTIVATVAAVLGSIVIVVSAIGGGGWEESVADSPVFTSQTLEERVDIWHGASGVVADRPLLGSGPDTLAEQFPPHRPADFALNAATVDEAHNILLDHAVSSGLIGALAYLLVLGVTIRNAVAARSSLDDHSRPLLGAFVGALGAYLIQGMFGIDVIPLSQYGWILVGAITVLADPRVRVAQTETKKRTAARPVGAVAILAIAAAVVLVAVGVLPAIASFKLERGIDKALAASQGNGDPEDAVTDFDIALRLNPLDFHSRLTAGVTVDDLVTARADLPPEQRERLRLWVLGRLDEAKARASNEPRVGLARGTSLHNLGLLGQDERFGQAEEQYARLIEREPHNPEPLIDRAAMRISAAQELGDRARLADAHQDLDAAAQLLNSSWAGGWLLTAQLYEEIGETQAALAAANEALAIDPNLSDAWTIVSRLSG